MKVGLPRNTRIIAALLQISFAVAIVVAIGPLSVSPDPNYSGWNLYSYFTVQSNILAAITFVIGAYALLRDRRLGRWFGILRGGAVLYMLVTALVYALLLQNSVEANSALGFNWKNFILHQLAPLFITVQWLLWPSREAISWRESLIWMVFPVLWLIYTFVRASFVDWYPYPFLDPALTGGALGVTGYVVGITVGFLILCLLVGWVSRERERNIALYTAKES